MTSMNTTDSPVFVSPAESIPDSAGLFSKSAMMKVALVTETYPPEINGVAMTLGRIVAGLVELGHHVHLVRPRQHKLETPLAQRLLQETLVRSLPIPRYPDLRFGLPCAGQLRKLWLAQRPDIVHIATQGPLGWSAINAARSLGLPISSSFHTNFDAYSRHYGIGLLKPTITGYLRKFHNKTDRTLVPTRSLVTELAATGYRNMALMSRGVDTRLFNPTRRSAELRAQWGLQENELAVIHVGRLAPEKNLALLLRSFDAIKADNATARLVLVGDGPLRAKLAAKYPQHIFVGMRTGEDLATHYASADLFLFPSQTETFGNVTSEAMASGLAVVSYDYAAAAELIRHQENGLLATLGDEAQFIAAACALAGKNGNNDSARKLGMTAAASIAHLDWRRVQQRFADTLNNVINQHQRRLCAEDALVVATD